MNIITSARAVTGALAVTILMSTAAAAQVGQGLNDLNSMPEAALAALPGMNANIAKAFITQRPFSSIVEANKFFLGQGLTQPQLTSIYEKAFIHINLNTGTEAEIRLIPRISNRMPHEFEEYRPWKAMAQFDKEIGKYVDAAEVNRLKQYVFIPLDLNTATDDQLKTIPNLGEKMLHELKEYRPWKSKAHFEKEIGKYVDAKEVARLWRYVVINP